MPYAVDFPAHASAIVAGLTEAGARLTPRLEEIGDALADKLRLVSVFGSQFKPSHMEPRVREAARRASPNGTGAYELLYRLERAPRGVDRWALYSGRDRVERRAGPIRAWHVRNRDTRRLRVLSAVPIPRWEDDLRALGIAFPEAVLEVHVRDEHRGGGDAPDPGRVHLRPVTGGRPGWLARLVRVALERPVPTLVLTGAGLDRWTPLARAALARSDVTTAPSLNDVVAALAIEAGAAVSDRSGPV